MTLVADSISPPEQVLCTHCNLPVPRGLVESRAAHQFCCQGCRTVYAVIHSCRMEHYYALLQRDRESGNAELAPAHVTGKRYSEFNDSSFLQMHAPLHEGVRTIDFYLEGVHCAACVWLVEKLPAAVPGVMESRLNLGKALARVSWAEGTVRLSEIARFLDSLGYPPHPARSSNARQIRTLDDRRHLTRIGVAGACAGNTMLLATALYAGLFATMAPAYTLAFRYLSMLIGIVALVWPGQVFFRGAWAAIKTRTPHLDLPISVGLAAGGSAGVINTISNHGEVYFDSLTVLVFLLLVGRFLLHRQQGVADDAVELLFSLTPMSAHRIGEHGRVEDVPISTLQRGDIVEVLAGESVPVDGTICFGETTLDESLLTGEAMPKRVKEGGAVHAGTVNISSPVRVSVQAAGEETRVGKLMRLVTECARRKTPMTMAADRAAGYFLAAVLAIAIAAFAWGYFRGRLHALEHAVAILIVACPCALGLATPLAMTVAIGRAAKRGILIKGGDALERLAAPGAIFLDKTGTLTSGRLSLVSWHGDSTVKRAVLAIESQASHPIAQALCETLRRDVAGDAIATEVNQSMRGGIMGNVGDDMLLIGSPRFIETHGVAPGEWADEIAKVLGRALTPVVIARNGSICAVAGLGDEIRTDSGAALSCLREAGWRVGVLSGDHPRVVAEVAKQLGIDSGAAVGGLLPEQKLERVEAELKRGPVVMVGDGVNDAAALAAATVGIAVHGGAEASLAAAGIYLNQPGLGAIADLVCASRVTVRVIRRGLFASLGYNAVAIALAAAGLINPLVAAILMPVSSLTVLSLALSGRTFPKSRRMR